MKAELIDYMGTDLTVVNAARVSFDKESQWESPIPHGYGLEHLSVKDQKLIQYLATHNHWTPFSHVMITMRETVPIFVTRQRFKHMVGFTYNEVSRRYVNGEPEYYKPDSWSGIADNVKQGAGDFLSAAMQDMANEQYWEAVWQSNDTYQDMLVYMAPEEARMVLPLCHMTRWRWSGSLDAVMNMCNLRLDSHAQSQTREVAMQIGGYVKKAFPQSWASYVKGDV